MEFSLDRDRKEALYVQLYQQLKHRIITHQLEPMMKLPSKRNLAEMNGISQNTVLHAYEQLSAEGYINAVERSGYYVADIRQHLHIDPPPAKKIVKEGQPEWRLDLTRSTPDKKLFPFNQLKRIYMDILGRQDATVLKESEIRGDINLRMAIQRYLRTARNVPAEVDQIVLAPSSYMLFDMLINVLPPHQSIAVEDPGHHGVNSLFEKNQMLITPIPLDKDGVQPEALYQSKANLLYVTPSHQYPTGQFMPINRRLELANWARKDDQRYLIEDDYDSEFKYAGLPLPSLKSLDQDDTVIFMGSFSRVLSPSFRVSYMVLPRHLVPVYDQIYHAMPSPINTLLQKVLAQYIDSGNFETHLNRARRFYKRKRDVLIKAIRSYDASAEIYGEDAGMHILLKPSVKIKALTLKEAFKKERVKIATLADFMMRPNIEADQIIFLSFSSLAEENIEPFVEKLYQFIRLAEDNRWGND